MNLFLHHIPKYITCDIPKPIEFETTEDLLNLEIVKKYKEYDNFSHFVKSDEVIMGIYNKGYKWIVIGYIANPDDIDLPLWEGVK